MASISMLTCRHLPFLKFWYAQSMLEHDECSVEKSVGIELVSGKGPRADRLLHFSFCLRINVKITLEPSVS